MCASISNTARSLGEIGHYFERRQSHTDGDRSHVTREELLLARGRISPEADATIGGILSGDNYQTLAKSSREGLFQDRQHLGLFGPLTLSAADLHNPSRSARVAIESASVDAPTDFIPAKDEIAKSLMRVVGSATVEDAELTTRELIRVVPVEILTTVMNAGYHVYVCRGAITDFRTDLRGEMDKTVGFADGGRKQIIVSTTEWKGKRELCYGSAMLLHEVLHAYDFATGASRDEGFLSARQKDLHNIYMPIMRREDSVGRIETFAHALVSYLLGEDCYAQDWPHLWSYFGRHFTPTGEKDQWYLHGF